MKKQKNKGITLIALVITIIILLILAGVSILALTESGLFEKTKEAKQKSENAQAEENVILKDYENTLNEYLSKTGENSSKEDDKIPVTLASKASVGDYVKYTPNIIDKADIAYTSLISDLTTYSGNTDKSYNTSNLIQQETLNWRVLDIVKDENGNDCVRLISEVPTTKSTVRLEGYNGYNNAVYLIDKTCNTLYNNSKYAKNVQNLKIEDIQKYMKETNYSMINPAYGIKHSPTLKYYPSILMQEKNQTITTSDATKQPTTRLDLSEQTNPINQIESNQVSSWTLKGTIWYKTMEENDFEYSIYYNLFINEHTNPYWISSRFVDTTDLVAAFYVRKINLKNVTGYWLYYSNDKSQNDTNYLRPVVTLKSDVLIDSSNSGDGSEVGKEYILK